ncbi:site-specific DNA-methyltransferase [Clostridium perfringens]|nr:site-specific DNA-methyltransferase [Clostridium perfringens]
MSNISKQKREKIELFFDKLVKEKDDFDTLISIKEIQKEINNKKFGLVWEEHHERVDMEIKTKVPVFKEDIEREITTDVEKKYNFLIEGDNLHTLYLLEKTHKNKVDVILIDPPYNTGNTDFIYDDSYVVKDDDFKHSKWLSFMNKRLRIMNRLLNETGMIIIHIDENEFAQLKLLCDEIFGEINHIGDFIWKARSGKGGTNNLIATQHEYILCYAKNYTKVNFRQDINITQKEKLENLRQWGQGVYRENRPTMFFPILRKNGVFSLPNEEEYAGMYVNNEFDDDYIQSIIKKYKDSGYEVFLPYIDGSYGRWRKGYIGVKDLINKNQLVVVDDKNGNKIIKKIIPANRESKIAIDSIILDCGSASTGTLQLKELFDNKKVFETTKPVEIEKFLLNLGVYNKPDAIVLDCFAGTGTTGNALLEINKEDNGRRTFILCTNNENKICEKVTYEKIKKLILGYNFIGKKDEILFEKNITLKDLKNSEKIMTYISKIIDNKKCEYDSISKNIKCGILRVIGTRKFSGKKEGLGSNLKYYKTHYISKKSEDKNYNITEKLLSHIEEMVQLEHGVKIDNSIYKIVFTDEELDRLEKNKNILDNCKVIYISSRVLLTNRQSRLFKRLGILVIPIPEYYFKSELREVGEV